MEFKVNSTVFALVLVYYSLQKACAIRTKDKMYENLDASMACFRRLNATHQVGCSSESGGSSGAIHFCESQEDLEFILRNGTAPPYVPVMPTSLFTPENVNKLKYSKKVSGLLLYVNRDKVSHFSHEHQCPNFASSLEGSCKPGQEWNPLGTGLLYQDIPFPIFYAGSEESVSFAKECFQKHNNFSFNTQRDRSLCSLQLMSFMFGTKNSEICIRRSVITAFNSVKFCDPLEDENVWSTLFPLVTGPNFTEPIRNFKYIVVAAKIDNTAMFDNTPAGAVSPITGVVTLLATAKYLKSILPADLGHRKNVLFLVFNGESYDYLGSQRFVYELLRDNFPPKENKLLPNININDIDLYIECSQLNKTKTVYAHYMPTSKPENFISQLKKYKGSLELGESDQGLPPASLHSFLKNRTKLPSLILTDHQSSYVNPFYNSIYDNVTNLNYNYLNLSGTDIIYDDNIQTHIQKVATMLAHSIYVEITNKTLQNTENTSADLQFIDELLHCYLEDAHCLVHDAIQKKNIRKHYPLSLYVGVGRSSKFITTLVGLTLGWVTGNITGEGNINCTNNENYAIRYYNMSKSLDELNTTKCFRITMNFTQAMSPAFVIDDYDWSSGEYSTWTESTWGEFNLRIFLKPSAAHENMTIAIGSMVLIFSFLFVYFVKSRSHILFAPQFPTLAPTNC